MEDKILVIDYGLQPYLDTWRLQHRLVKARAEGEICDILILVEHPPVITLGRRGSHDSIKVSLKILERQGISLMAVERGGDATFHGPGQIVGYPIFLLAGRGRKVRAFVEYLEEAMIRVLSEFGIMAHMNPGSPGVWVGRSKIGAIGITVKNEVSFHGFALNVNNDLSGFDLIHPCGMKNAQVTSMEQCLGKKVSMDLVKAILIEQISWIFTSEIEQVLPGSLPWTGLEPITKQEG